MVRTLSRLYWLPLLGLVGCLGGGTGGGRIRGAAGRTSGPGPGPSLVAFQQPNRWQQRRCRSSGGSGGGGGGGNGHGVRPVAATTMSAPSQRAPQPAQPPPSQPPSPPQAQAQPPSQRRAGGGRRWREGDGERWHPVGGDLADVTLLRSVEAGIRESQGKLNATACRRALQACSRLHQPDKAAWLIEEMRRRGPQPDVECYGLAVDTIARKGHWSVADGLLQAMRAGGMQPGPGGYGVVMAACHRAGQGERVLALLEEMDASGVDAPATAYATAVHAALSAKQHGKMLAVLDAMLRKGVELDERLLDTIMADLVKGGRWEEGRAVLASLQSAGRASGEALGSVYARVVEACIPEGQWQEAFRLLEEMQAAGLLVLPPSTHTAAAASHTGDGSGGSSSSGSSTAPPSQAAASASASASPEQQGGSGGGTLAAAVSGLGGADRPDGPASVAEASYRAAMGACRRAGAVEQGVFALLDYMDSVAAAAHAGRHAAKDGNGARKSHPSTEIYSLAFATCFEKERWDALPRLLQHMEGHGLKPDGKFFQALVRVLATSPSSSPVARLRQQQREQRRQQRQGEEDEEEDGVGGGDGNGVAMGEEMSTALRKLPWGGKGPLPALSSCSSSLLVLFNTAIHACAAGGDWRLALDLLHDMKKEGLRPDYYSYQAAMAACQRAGEWERVLTLLSRMEGDGYGPPDLASYEIVMSACLRAKAWDRVPGILVRMEESGARPDSHFVEWVMKALAVEGQWQIAVEVLESLQQQAQAQQGSPQLSNVVYNLAIKACDAGGEWKTAVKLVEAMRQGGMHPDLYSFNTAISACQKAGKVGQITRLLARMEEDYPPVPPNAYTFITATTACLQAGAFDKLFEVLAATARSGQIDIRDDRFFRVLLHKFRSEGLWREALNLLHVIRQKGRASQLFTKMVIETCAAAGEWKTAGYLLIEMRREGQTPDAASYAAAMKACLEAGEKQRALGLWDEMVASGVRAPSKETLSLAMAAALDLRDWDRIDALLALDSASVRVDQRFFSDMMAGFVQSGRWGSALNLLRVLGDGEDGADGSGGGGVSQRVTAGFYEQAVHACCVAGATDAAVRTLDEMALMGFAPSTFIYNVAMEACARTGDLMGVLGLKRRMQNARVEVDVVSCNTLLNALAICGKWDEALNLLQRMPSLYGVRPNLVSFNTALKACVAGRRWREAVVLLNTMRSQQSVAPDAVSYRTAMHACMAGGEAERALRLSDKMREDGLAWDISTYNVVIKACAEARQPEVAWELFQEMQSAGIQADLRTYTTLMNAWVEAGKGDRAIRTFTEMRAAGLEPDAYAWTVGIKACGVCGLVDQALSYMNEILASFTQQPKRPPSGHANAEQRLDAITFNLAMQVCEEQGEAPRHHEAALRLFERMAQEGVAPNWITYGIVFRLLMAQARVAEVQALLTQVERRLSSGAEGDDEGDTAARPAATSQPTTPLLSGLGDGPSEAATPASFPPSSSSSPPTPLTAATGEAFFADAMRRAVAAKQWEIATQLHALALGCGAVTAVGPVGEGDEVVVSSAGPSRRLDLYMYGGALAAARARGQGKDERALVEAIAAADIVQDRDQDEYLDTLEACARSGDWGPLMEFFSFTQAAAHSHQQQQHGGGRGGRGGREGGGGGKGGSGRWRKGEGRGRVRRDRRGDGREGNR